MANSHNYPLIGQAFIGSKTLSASFSLSGTDSGKAFTNAPATGSITITLPLSRPGLVYYVKVVAAQNIVIQPQTADAIQGSAAGASITLSGVGTTAEFVCYTPGIWDTAPSTTIGGPSTLIAPVVINATAGQISLTVNAPSAGVSINAVSASSTAIFAQEATISSSGGDYPYFGYNVKATAVAGTYNYAVTDFASAISFPSGGIQVRVAASGTAGNPITWHAQVSVANSGAVTIATPLSAVTALTVNASATGQTAISASDGTHVVNIAPGVTGAINVDNALDLRIAGTQAIGISSARAVNFPGVSTTASAANAFLDNANSNNLLRSTSSLRYKTNVNSLAAPDFNALLRMRPVTYTSLCAGDDPTKVHLGFIAEEIAAIDPRLVFYTWSQYQAQTDISIPPQPTATAQLIPDGVQYDRIVPLLVGAIQTLTQRIAALEQKGSPAAPALSVSSTYGLTATSAFSGPVLPIMTLPAA